METSMINSMCRCCASEGAFKDVKTAYHWMGEEEIYADMLRECFDINLFQPEGAEDGGICEVCITQLRNAVNFKKQVLHTEEQFKKQIQSGNMYKPSIVKVEVPMEHHVSDDDDNASAEDGYSEPEFEIPIKTEDLEETEKRPKSKKRAAPVKKATSTRAKKGKVEEGEPSTKRYQQFNIAKQEIKYEVETEGNKIAIEESTDIKYVKSKITDEPGKLAARKIVSDINEYRGHLKIKSPIKSTKNIHGINYKDTSKPVNKSSKPKKNLKIDIRLSQEELNKHHHNLREILKFTNATPILRRGGIGYICTYCDEEHVNPADLKKHTLETHQPEGKAMFGSKTNFTYLSRYCVKLDITSLRCNICDTDINTLEDSIEHLQNKHDRIMYTEINNHILPFKFDTSQLTCFMCFNVFDKFKVLQEHMHIHYRNYVCDVCDAGFVNQGCLNLHKEVHKKGTFPCSFCPKIFDTLVKKKSHENQIHSTNIINKRMNKCGYCNERFKEHYMKEKHLSKFHGVIPKTYKCTACDKVFLKPKRLREHIKRDHLMEKRYNCTQCEKRFFSSQSLSEHMLTHTGEKKFQCALCLKCYGRKTTLREHMRIHNNDRRFKCKHCGQSFIQKCTWKSHMKSKHDEIV